MHFFKTILFLTFFCILSCHKAVDQQLLLGNWKVASYFSEGKQIQSPDLKQISFSFYPNSRYQYTSTLNRKEAGKYHISGNSLFTTDTLATPQKEKMVQIAFSTPDSVSFKMLNDGKEQVLKLYKLAN